MVDRDVILEKVNSIQNCLERIHVTFKGDVRSLDNLDVQDIVVLNLQRSIQLCIDIAFHVTASEKLGLPQNLKDAFSILAAHNILDAVLANQMEKLTGFRNIAVHDYESIKVDVLHKILQLHLKDIEDFYTKIIIHFKL